MRHVIFTRIALDNVCPKHADLQRGDRTESFWASRKVVKHIIEVWRETASLCYRNQTEGLDFTVVLLYSAVNKDLLDKYEWPPWVEFHECNGQTWSTKGVPLWVQKNIKPGEAVTLSRIDADDSWSNDWFAFLNTLSYEEKTLILYNWQHQYHMTDDMFSAPVYHPSPMFATLYFPSFPADYEPAKAIGKEGTLLGVMGNHAWYAAAKHVEFGIAYVMMRFRRLDNRESNIMSRFGYIGNKRVDIELIEKSPRFVGYGDA